MLFAECQNSKIIMGHAAPSSVLPPWFRCLLTSLNLFLPFSFFPSFFLFFGRSASSGTVGYFFSTIPYLALDDITQLWPCACIAFCTSYQASNLLNPNYLVSYRPAASSKVEFGHGPGDWGNVGEYSWCCVGGIGRCIDVRFLHWNHVRGKENAVTDYCVFVQLHSINSHLLRFSTQIKQSPVDFLGLLLSRCTCIICIILKIGYSRKYRCVLFDFYPFGPAYLCGSIVQGWITLVRMVVILEALIPLIRPSCSLLIFISV